MPIITWASARRAGIRRPGTAWLAQGVLMLVDTRWFSTVLVVLCLTTTAAAQTSDPPQRHDGNWFGVGYGLAYNNLQCTGCVFTGSNDPWHGGAGIGGFVNAGRALSQRLLLGVEGNATGTGGAKRSTSVFQLLLIATYFPRALKGLHLNSGAGLTIYVLEDPGSAPGVGDGGSVVADGLALRLSAGYDVAFKKRYAFTPFASIAGTTVNAGSLASSGNAGPVTRLQNRVIAQLGLAVFRY